MSLVAIPVSLEVGHQSEHFPAELAFVRRSRMRFAMLAKSGCRSKPLRALVTLVGFGASVSVDVVRQNNLL